jgi:hypothetical protein
LLASRLVLFPAPLVLLLLSGFSLRAGGSGVESPPDRQPFLLGRSEPMQAPRLNKIADKVILLQTGPSGDITPVTLYKKSRKKKKKSSAGLRPAENILKRVTDAQKAFADTFANRFKSSRRKRTNGWLRDLGGNVMKAADKARKRFRMDRLPF